jgi:hypothetical protein
MFHSATPIGGGEEKFVPLPHKSHVEFNDLARYVSSPYPCPNFIKLCSEKDQISAEKLFHSLF